MRVGVIPGRGGVVRHGDTVVVIGASPPPSQQLAGSLIEATMNLDGPARIRELARLVLAEPEPPALGIATFEGGEVAVFVLGEIDLCWPGGRLHGADHVLGESTTIERDGGFSIVTAGADVPELADWNHLEEGSVRGDGVVVSAATDEPDQDEDQEDQEDQEDEDQDEAVQEDDEEEEDDPTGPMEAVAAPPVGPAGGDAEGDVAEGDSASFVSLKLSPDADLSDRQPLPIAGQPDESTAVDGPLYEQPVEVIGVYSPRGFFNHPDAKYCSRTGVKMGASQTKVLTVGPRPPLGVITFDDGSTLTVRWNTVLGRDPQNDERVHRSEAAPFVISDVAQSVSRRHAFLELVDWDVLISDLGSRNHTYVQDGPDDPRRALASGERAALHSGMIVHLGDRSFVYHEHHVR